MRGGYHWTDEGRTEIFHLILLEPIFGASHHANTIVNEELQTTKKCKTSLNNKSKRNFCISLNARWWCCCCCYYWFWCCCWLNFYWIQKIQNLILDEWKTRKLLSIPRKNQFQNKHKRNENQAKANTSSLDRNALAFAFSFGTRPNIPRFENTKYEKQIAMQW